MQDIPLLNTPTVKLLVEDNVIAVTSDAGLTTISSAIYNGGFKKVNAILNIQVPEGYSDIKLHEDPLHLVKLSSAKVNVHENYLAMVTAAKVNNRHHTAKTDGIISVNVIATAGASHGESAGEIINAEHSDGTINIIVIIHGNPTDSCLAAAFVTAIEAKTAALDDLDIRSRYSGEAATGSITDSLSVATTNAGEKIELGGPASRLGQLVAPCVREAVKVALQKQDGTFPSRSVADRLKARRLSTEKLAFELSKTKNSNAGEMSITKRLQAILADPLYASFLLAAAKLDDDIKKGLIPNELSDVANVSEQFGHLIMEDKSSGSKNQAPIREYSFNNVNLPPFTKQALLNILKNNSL